MGLHKLTAGDGYTYLTRQVAANDRADRGPTSLGEYYAEQGESPGLWMGAGLEGLGIRPGEVVTETQMKSLFGAGRHPNAEQLGFQAGALGRSFNVYDSPTVFRQRVAAAYAAHNVSQGREAGARLAADERARIRTEVAVRMFGEQHARPPASARELAGFIAKASRPATTAVAGYDLTFSPVKSVSTLWALAPIAVADQVAAAHQAAVADTIAWLEREVAFTRVGHGGLRQVPVCGLVATAFTHRDSRAGDPDLHTHVAVANKVQTVEPEHPGGGRWLALDGRVLFKAKVSASERYNTRLEAELVDRLGVTFVDRPTEAGRRPIREIAGISPRLMRAWSTRRHDIVRRQARLSIDFQRVHGRPPTAIEATALAQQANLETRAAKHAPRSHGDQRAFWRQEAAETLGDLVLVDEMVTSALQRPPTAAGSPGRDWVANTARTVVDVLEGSRATWQVWHVRAEAERQARAGQVPLSRLDESVDAVIQHVLTVGSVRLASPDPVAEPAELRRPDGTSVYEVHGAARYTSSRILTAERVLLEAADEGGGRRVSQVGIATELATAGSSLDDAQAAMVRQLATSGARLQVALAPAGTGKTTAMRALARAWHLSGGTILGLAPSAAAADELKASIGGRSDTIAKLVWDISHGDDAALTMPPTSTLTTGVTNPVPINVPTAGRGLAGRVGVGTLVVIDEAGMAGTADLATVVRFVLDRGGSVRLVGDDQQLAAVAAGGILRDLARHPRTATLAHVHRFDDPAEAAASLALREGDSSALGYYADHARIHMGDLGSAADQAFEAWKADTAGGKDTILLAPTRELATQLNERARDYRIASAAGVPTTDPQGGQSPGPEVRLRDNTRASAGDMVVTRRNDRRLVTSDTDWVKNGDRWQVLEVLSGGGLRVRHRHARRSTVLPPDYVAEHVQLGYAGTVHSAQGITVDSTHTVLTGEETRQVLYVAASRGRSANHVYLAVGSDGDPHAMIRPEAVKPPTPIEVLANILGRDGSQESATSTRDRLTAPATLLHDAVLRYQDTLGFAAEQVLGHEAMTTLDRDLEEHIPGLTSNPAYPELRGGLALCALDGDDPLQLTLEAARTRELESADDLAAVLAWRLPSGRSHGPLPWVPSIPDRLGDHPQWGPYLTERRDRVGHLSDLVFREAMTSTRDTGLTWTEGLMSPDHRSLRGELAVWRAAFGVPDTDPRPSGAPQPSGEVRNHQRQLDRRVRAAFGPTPDKPAAAGTDFDGDVGRDPHRGLLRRRLSTLEPPVADVGGLVRAALALPRPLPADAAADALWWRIVGMRATQKAQAGPHSPPALTGLAALQAAYLRDIAVDHPQPNQSERRSTAHGPDVTPPR